MSDCKCARCGKPLESDEVALHKKLINRGAKSGFMCIDCLAKHFEVSAGSLSEKMEQYKKMGCTLFDCNKIN